MGPIGDGHGKGAGSGSLHLGQQTQNDRLFQSAMDGQRARSVHQIRQDKQRPIPNLRKAQSHRVQGQTHGPTNLSGEQSHHEHGAGGRTDQPGEE